MEIVAGLICNLDAYAVKLYTEEYLLAEHNLFH